MKFKDLHSLIFTVKSEWTDAKVLLNDAAAKSTDVKHIHLILEPKSDFANTLSFAPEKDFFVARKNRLSYITHDSQAVLEGFSVEKTNLTSNAVEITQSEGNMYFIKHPIYNSKEFLNIPLSGSELISWLLDRFEKDVNAPK